MTVEESYAKDINQSLLGMVMKVSYKWSNKPMD